MNNFKERLEHLIGGESVNSFAKKCELSESLIRNYLKGSTPGLDKLQQIAKATDVSVGWLAAGEENTNKEIEVNKPQHLVHVPLINVKASAGDGKLVTEEKSTSLLAFHKEYLQKTWFISSSHLFCMEVDGESMAPTLNHGEILICSYDVQHRVPADGVFVIRLEEAVMVKRLQFLPGKTIKVSSDNNIYEPFTIKMDDGVDFDILGKVLLVNGLRRV